MIKRIMLLLSVISINTCGMNEAQLKDFVESYEIVKEIPFPNNRTFSSILYDSHGNRVIAGTMGGIGVWGCEDYELTYFDPSSTKIQDMAYDQENDLLYYIGGDDRKVWSKDMQQGKDGKHIDLQFSVDSEAYLLVYNGIEKQLYGAGRNRVGVFTRGQLDSWNALKLDMNAFCNGVNTIGFGNIDGTDTRYFGTGNGFVQAWQAQHLYKSKSLGNLVSSLRVDQYRNHVWVNGMKRGVITQCDMDLENAKNIQYAGALTSTQAFGHDCTSNLLCIASDIVKEGGSQYNMYIVSPQITDDFGAPIIQINMPLKNFPTDVACDRVRNIFYVCLHDRICVVKPKTPLLTILTSQAFLIYSHFLSSVAIPD